MLAPNRLLLKSFQFFLKWILPLMRVLNVHRNIALGFKGLDIAFASFGGWNLRSIGQ